MDNRVLGLLGLCARAGGLVSGENSCELTIRRGQALLVLQDELSSENAKKKFADACLNYRLPRCLFAGGALGAAIGKPGRMVVAITAAPFAERMLTLLEQGHHTVINHDQQS